MERVLDRSSLDTGRVLRTIARMLRQIHFVDPTIELELKVISRRLDEIAGTPTAGELQPNQ